MRAVAVSMHDVAPETWRSCRALLSEVLPRGFPATLLVVPRWHGGLAIDDDASFATALRSRIAGGDEVALHGYLHRDDAARPRTPAGWVRRRLYTAGEGEFDSIAAGDARRRLGDGLASLARIGIQPRAFVAPAWLMGEAAWQALVDTPLTYTCTRDTLVRIADRAPIPAPSLVWSSRSAWRRRASAYWNARRIAALAAVPLIRVALHPGEISDASAVRFWRNTIATLADGRDAVLEFEACEQRLAARR